MSRPFHSILHYKRSMKLSGGGIFSPGISPHNLPCVEKMLRPFFKSRRAEPRLKFGFISCTGLMQSRGLWLSKMVRLSGTKNQAGLIRVTPQRTRQNWPKFTSARRGTTYKTGLNCIIKLGNQYTPLLIQTVSFKRNKMDWK